MERVHGPVVAGSFYPAEPGVLRATVRRLLRSAQGALVEEGVRALIVPHAGYLYSGPVAASAYALLERGSFDRVVLIGPSHFLPFLGLAVPDATAWSTPLGAVPIEAPTPGTIPTAVTVAPAYAREHCLEVQLPFLQETLGSFTVTMLLTGDIAADDAADALDALIDDSTLLVVSSDLSHYDDYETARRLDRATANAIIDLRPGDLGPASACGRDGIQAVLDLALRRRWRMHLLDLRNSGDTAGPRDRVVGYGAFAIHAS